MTHNLSNHPSIRGLSKTELGRLGTPRVFRQLQVIYASRDALAYRWWLLNTHGRNSVQRELRTSHYTAQGI